MQSVTQVAYKTKNYIMKVFKGTKGKWKLGSAKLIAAAPKLLKACIKAEKHHQGGHSETGHLLRKAIYKALN